MTAQTQNSDGRHGGRRRFRDTKLQSPVWVRLSAEEKQTVDYAASLDGLATSSWAARILLREAEERIEHFERDQARSRANKHRAK